MYEAANREIIRHRWLFRPRSRFIAAANLVFVRIEKTKIMVKLQKGPTKAEIKRTLTAVHQDSTTGGRRASIAAPIYEMWQLAPNPAVEGWLPVIKWCLVYPLHAALYYTIPDCKKKPVLFLATFTLSVTWTAIFSYIMVWMVTLIGFTLGIPDSVMGITFLAAGTSIPDAYASIHVAKAVSYA